MNINNRKILRWHILFMCSLFCMHTCTPVSPITDPLWWLQVSVIILTSTQAVGGGRELMRFCMGPESRGGSGEVGSMACCSQDDIQCLERTQTFPHIPGMLQEACRTVWHSTCYRHFWPKRVTNHRVTGLFRQPWSVPVRARAGTKCCTEMESRMEAVKATWRENGFCQNSQRVPQRN